MNEKKITQKEVEDFILKGMTDALLNKNTFIVDFREPVPELGGKVDPIVLADALKQLGKDGMINVRMPDDKQEAK